ncbi:MAG: pentapeptide repeat-containing protein [Candidatus Electrothrix sp. ATG2]|nr:pentapeptide repeat-containing protein [Candidatus Electrothrix sp. ATG2]
MVFGGLDELALQGKAASEVANSFVDEVLRRIQEGNSFGKQRQVIITGRTIAVQSVADKLREPRQISYVLPYFVEEEEKEKFYDPDGLLAEDQRQRWWRQYGKAAGKDYAGLPDDLDREHLAEITAQPLLNYLVALSYDRKKIAFTDETTLNQIYADLISAVYWRRYEEEQRGENRGVNACTGGLDEQQFIRVLEEIALAVWHGDGRTATVSSIQKKFTGRLKKYLERFQEGAEAGVTRLLTAFYFRQSDNRQDGDPTFEFTHKSFGEYLTALRIIRLLRQMQKQRQRQEEDPDDGWSEKEALQHWTSFCAVTAMDDDLLRFISNEFLVMTQEELRALQEMVRNLLSYTINQGLPFPDEFLSKGFKEHLRLARNAEEALLAMHFHIAELTGQVSKLDLESDTVFGEWISRLKGASYRIEGTVAVGSLGFLDLSGCYFLGQNFHEADFEMTCFNGSLLAHGLFADANFSGGECRKAEFSSANLELADFEDAELLEASFEGADLERANFECANLEDVNFRDANLYGANFTNANLKGANFEGADLTGTNLKGTILENKDS